MDQHAKRKGLTTGSERYCERIGYGPDGNPRWRTATHRTGLKITSMQTARASSGGGTTVVPNNVLFDNRLSITARGVYARLLSVPTGTWIPFHAFGPNPRQLLADACNELQDAGLVEFTGYGRDLSLTDHEISYAMASDGPIGPFVNMTWYEQSPMPRICHKPTRDRRPTIV